jgi:hypothetical protein
MLKLFEELEERLKRTDMVQFLTLFFAVLIFVILTRWPTQKNVPNETWFALAQTRITVLALLALGYGSVYSLFSRKERLLTCLALVSFVLLSLPFDVATFAASFPATPIWWSVLLPLIDTVAFFGAGLLLGSVLSLLRLRALLPLAVPGLLVGFIALDLRLRENMLNPLTASIHPSAPHLLIMSVIALATGLILLKISWRELGPLRRHR